MKPNVLLVSIVVAACGSKSPGPACPPQPAPVAAAPPVVTPPANPPPAEPESPTLPPNVELSVSAERNMEKAKDALAKADLPAARAYFTFVVERFPRSTFIHDAELGLLDADAADFIAQGRDDVDTVNGHCAFISHHPEHPRVANGDVACQVNKIQHTPCVAGDRSAVKYCGKPAYCALKEVAKRPECK